jgi:hypothetical protein
MEIWKDVIGYEGLYQVSNLGRVKSLARYKIGKGNALYKVYERILKYKPRSYAYKVVDLYKDSKSKSCRVHRLVAMAFIPNPNNYPIVSHLDNDPTNNKVENLEWATQSLNIQHCINSNRGRWSNQFK